MKRVFPILIFLLILSYRQAPAETGMDRDHTGHIILRESHKVYDTQELGVIPDVDQNSLRELPAVFRAFQSELPNLTGVFIPILFRFSYSIHSNPLLTDRPPPGIGQ